MSKTEDKGFVQFKMRLPSVLKDWIDERAAKNQRSAGGEITFRLEESRRQEEQREAA